MSQNTLKQKLYALLMDDLDQGIRETLRAIEMARESLHSETKSSMGDKYETGRAMVQIELEKSSGRLQNLQQLKKEMTRINPDKPNERCETGCLVSTNHGVYFIAIGSGKVVVDNEVYFAISPGSPLGNRLRGMRQGDAIECAGRTYKITKVD